MKLPTPNPKERRQAQAMVEFALVLPILLLIVYGLLEVGRLVFIYSVVATSSREAVRYGSATGFNNAGVPRFQDCAGIRNAAKTTGFLLDLQDGDITIQYDHGPGSGAFDECSGAADLALEALTGDRIRVQVTSVFTPVVPFVPLSPITITSSSSRTLLMSIFVPPASP